MLNLLGVNPKGSAEVLLLCHPWGLVGGRFELLGDFCCLAEVWGYSDTLLELEEQP